MNAWSFTARTVRATFYWTSTVNAQTISLALGATFITRVLPITGAAGTMLFQCGVVMIINLLKRFTADVTHSHHPVF
jgi:hypothetical protein